MFELLKKANSNNQTKQKTKTNGVGCSLVTVCVFWNLNLFLRNGKVRL